MRRMKSASYKYKPRSVRRLEKKNKRNLLISTGLILLGIYFLLTWGLPAFIGSLTVFNKFKPENNQINKPISEDPAIAPPVLNIPYEATNTATIKVNGYASADNQVEIYVDGDKKDTTTTKSDGSFTSGDIPLVLGTNNIYGKTVNSDNKTSLPSKTIQLIYNNEKPTLDVSQPTDNQQIQGGDKKITVSGKTDSENNITVNGNLVIVSSEGNFSTNVSINEGENTITITATNSVGNTTTITKKVTYTP